MELSVADIQLLYGKTLWRSHVETPVAPVATPAPESAPAPAPAPAEPAAQVAPPAPEQNLSTTSPAQETPLPAAAPPAPAAVPPTVVQEPAPPAPAVEPTPEQSAPEQIPQSAAEPATSQPASQPTTQSAASPQPAAQWQYQRGALVAAVMPAPHAALPQAIALLHKMCAALDVTPRQVNLLCTQSVQTAELLQARARFVLIFGPTIYPSDTEVLTVQQTEIYRLPELTTLLADVAAKRKAWELMKLFKDRI